MYYLDYLKRTDTFPQSVYHSAKRAATRALMGTLAPGATVLDAACGIGNMTGRFCLEYAVIGIDSELPAVRESRQRHGGVYLQGDLYSLPFRDGSFDGILFLDAIEHFTDPVAALRELSRTLKPGGRILICTINYANPLWWVLENSWHRLFAGTCRTYSREVHPTRYDGRLLSRHCQELFRQVALKKRMLRMELFYTGEKARDGR